MFCHVPSNYLPQLMERSMMNCLGGYVVHGCGITCSRLLYRQTTVQFSKLFVPTRQQPLYLLQRTGHILQVVQYLQIEPVVDRRYKRAV